MLHTEGGVRQNCVAAELRGEAAIASDCTVREAYPYLLQSPTKQDKASLHHSSRHSYVLS
jgi:hypothetical protein